jgi:nitrous oxide reductase accessory protein NosL
MRDSRSRAGAVVMLAAALMAGCAPAGPPTIATGTDCVTCGMPIGDPRFACARRDLAARRKGWRVYDSIECLARDWKRSATPRDVYAADYDQARLHRGDSLWVVHGSFPSPMGGGLAAFLDRAAAKAVADQTRGVVMTLDSLLATSGEPRP